MAEVKIELDAEVLAEKVTNALVTSMVGKLVSGVITNRIIKEESLNREYERAVDEVAKKMFIEYLQNDEKFKKEVREMITQTANDKFLKSFVEKMNRHVIW